MSFASHLGSSYGTDPCSCQFYVQFRFIHIYFTARFVLKLEFMLTSKFVLVSGLYICLRYFHVLALIRIYKKFRFIFFLDLR